MAELTTALNQLLKGKHTIENLNAYRDGLCSLYKRMAYLKLSMNYFTFAEIHYELNENHKRIVESATEQIQELMNMSVFASGPIEEGVASSVELLRVQLKNTMEVLTAFVDRFQIYEYMLNRVEYRFSKSEFDDAYYNTEFEEQIMQYILSEKDNSVINMKIAQVVAQLPMRLSKNKFFDLLKDALSLYKNSDKAGVAEFVYMVKTAGALYEPEGFATQFPDLLEVSRMLDAADYENMKEAEYKQFRSLLDDVTVLVEEYSDAFVMMTEVVNDLYTIVLAKDALFDVNERETLTQIMRQASRVIEEEADIYELEPSVFEPFEGLQEKIGNLLMTPDSSVTEVNDVCREAIKESGMEAQFEILKVLSKLQSASLFADLKDDTDTSAVDEQYLIEQAVSLANAFGARFDASQRAYKRAVMASVIGNLPSFFHNTDELRNYIQVSLGQCKDAAERQATMELIHLLIASE